MPGELIATIALSASSVLLGLLLPLGAGLAIVGIVRGFVVDAWGTFVAGLLVTVGLVAAGVLLRAWGGSLMADDSLTAGGSLGTANQSAAVVFSAIAPLGVILGAVFVLVGLLRLAVDRRRSARE